MSKTLDLRSTSPQRFDAIGALLAFITLRCFALGMTQGQGQEFGSISALALLSSVIIFIIFLLLQSRLTHPLVELHLFRNLQFSMGLLSGWIVFILSMKSDRNTTSRNFNN